MTVDFFKVEIWNPNNEFSEISEFLFWFKRWPEIFLFTRWPYPYTKNKNRFTRWVSLRSSKKIGSHIRRLKRTHDNPILLLTSLNVALSRHRKKSLDPTHNSQIQFSSSKWGRAPTMLLLITKFAHCD